MEIALVITSFLTLALSVSYYFSQKQLSMIKQAAMNLVLEAQNLSPSDADIHQENFIKFLSDSREWAFDYIEDFQASLQKFIDEVQPQIDYYNNYGIVVEGMIPPHDFALKKISKEVEELKRFLPQEQNDRR